MPVACAHASPCPPSSSPTRPPAPAGAGGGARHRRRAAAGGDRRDVLRRGRRGRDAGAGRRRRCGSSAGQHVAARAGRAARGLRAAARDGRRRDRVGPPVRGHERDLRVGAAGRAARPRCPVHCVDSRQVGVATGFAALAAADVLDAGGSAAEAAEAARARAAASSSLFYVDTLEYLRRGGRIGAAAALLGGALAVKPLLQIEDGRVATLERVRTAGPGARPAGGAGGAGGRRAAGRRLRRPPGQPGPGRRSWPSKLAARLADEPRRPRGLVRRARRGARRARRARACSPSACAPRSEHSRRPSRRRAADRPQRGLVTGCPQALAHAPTADAGLPSVVAMRTRRPSPEHQEAVSRRLAQLERRAGGRASGDRALGRADERTAARAGPADRVGRARPGAGAARGGRAPACPVAGPARRAPVAGRPCAPRRCPRRCAAGCWLGPAQLAVRGGAGRRSAWPSPAGGWSAASPSRSWPRGAGTGRGPRLGRRRRRGAGRPAPAAARRRTGSAPGHRRVGHRRRGRQGAPTRHRGARRRAPGWSTRSRRPGARVPASTCRRSTWPGPGRRRADPGRESPRRRALRRVGGPRRRRHRPGRWSTSTPPPAELETLPEVGPVTAAAILAWRDRARRLHRGRRAARGRRHRRGDPGQARPHVTV